MKFSKKKLSFVLTGAILTGGILTGCGSQNSADQATSSSNTAATTNNTAASTNTNQNTSQPQNGKGHNGQGMIQALKNAGASDTDAQNLAKLIQQTHTDPKWVIDQLKNNVSAANITSDINSGKAPKRQPNPNHKSNSDNQNNTSGSANQTSPSTPAAGSNTTNQ